MNEFLSRFSRLQRVAALTWQLCDNQVVGHRTLEENGYTALIIGAVDHPKPLNVDIFDVVLNQR